MRRRPPAMRRFDPRAVGRYERRQRSRRRAPDHDALLPPVGPGIGPARAAELEVEWWRAHRENQYGDHALGEALVVALRDLYAYTYDEPPETVRRAAELHALLVRSYAALLGAVYR